MSALRPPPLAAIFDFRIFAAARLQAGHSRQPLSPRFSPTPGFLASRFRRRFREACGRSIPAGAFFQSFSSFDSSTFSIEVITPFSLSFAIFATFSAAFIISLIHIGFRHCHYAID